MTLVRLPDEDAGTLLLPTRTQAKLPADPSIMFDWKETLPGTD
jgi:hypothetical protein